MLQRLSPERTTWPPTPLEAMQSIRDYLGHTFEEMTMQYIDYMPRKIAKENDAYFEEEENSLLACMQKGEKHG